MNTDEYLPADTPRAWRLLLAIHTRDFDAFDATLGEVGDCPQSLRLIIKALAPAAAVKIERLHGGTEGAIANAMSRIADSLDRRNR